MADTFDAMTSNRPYRMALPLGTAREEIRRESGHQFDPEVVEVISKIPAGVWESIRRDVAGLGGSLASKRAPLETPVLCKKGDTEFDSRSLNISESGMLLAPLGQIGVGEELELEFWIPHTAQPLRPRVQVIRKESRGVGVRFITLTLEARESIRRFTGAGMKEALAS